MHRTYYCPHCSALLNPNVKVILSAVHGDKRGLILLSPQPGNYKAIIPPDMGIQQGTAFEIRCPVCNADLTSREDPNLATLNFRIDSGGSGEVRFSKIYGQQATYVISGEETRAFGMDAQIYGSINFFGEGIEELD